MSETERCVMSRDPSGRWVTCETHGLDFGSESRFEQHAELESLRQQLAEAVGALRKVEDYAAGMLAAIDSDSSAPDIPGRAELLEDVLKRARDRRCNNRAHNLSESQRT